MTWVCVDSLQCGVASLLTGGSCLWRISITVVMLVLVYALMELECRIECIVVDVLIPPGMMLL